MKEMLMRNSKSLRFFRDLPDGARQGNSVLPTPLGVLFLNTQDGKVGKSGPSRYRSNECICMFADEEEWYHGR